MGSTCRMMSFATIALAASTALAAAQATSHLAATPTGETLAENAWDFNAPYGVPGFAPMRPTDDVRAMVAGMHSAPRLLDDPLAASVASVGGSKAAADRSVGLYKWAR